eukprot:2489580-Rhodomonas_salina.1
MDGGVWVWGTEQAAQVRPGTVTAVWYKAKTSNRIPRTNSDVSCLTSSCWILGTDQCRTDCGVCRAWLLRMVQTDQYRL